MDEISIEQALAQLAEGHNIAGEETIAAFKAGQVPEGKFAARIRVETSDLPDIEPSVYGMPEGAVIGITVIATVKAANGHNVFGLNLHTPDQDITRIDFPDVVKMMQDMFSNATPMLLQGVGEAYEQVKLRKQLERLGIKGDQ